MIHGTADPLVAHSGGRATARAIPGAKLMSIEGMGHDLPRAVWPRLIDAIAEHAAQAPESSRARPIPTGPPDAALGPAGIGSPSSCSPGPAGPSAAVGSPTDGGQACCGMCAAGRAPVPARPHAHQPVQVVATVRATVRPAAVQRAEHPLLLASEQSHPLSRFRSRILLDPKPLVQAPLSRFDPAPPDSYRLRMDGTRLRCRHINHVLRRMST